MAPTSCLKSTFRTLQRLFRRCKHSQGTCHCIKSTSGPARTHQVLLDTTPTRYGPRVAHRDTFRCQGAVDAVRLLHLARRELLSIAHESGANVLLDEEWRCKISHPKFAKEDKFNVSIVYSATIAESCWPDAQRPVEIESVKGVGGLMTILKRKE